MLVPVREHWTIVIVGKWNVGIFSPIWLAENLFENAEVVVEYPVAPGAPLRITGNGISLIPFNHRLILNPTELSDGHLERVESVSCRLLNLLPHTPITKTGINYAYKVEEPSSELLEHFPSADDNNFADQNMEMLSRSFSRRLQLEDRVLNLEAKLDSSSIMFSFNFDADTPNAEAATARIRNQVLQLRAKTEEILGNPYGLRREN